MAGLAEFLLARIAEDETAAQEARGWKAPTGRSTTVETFCWVRR